MIICGVDPGLSGALTLLDTADGSCQTHDMPTHVLERGGRNKREVDPHSLADLLRERRIGHAFVEAVSSMPGQGVSSVFAFGKAFGIVVGVLAAVGVPTTFVVPAKWKRDLHVPSAKDGARARASQLLPHAADQWSLVKDHGKAESALIAWWGVQSFSQIGRAA